MEKRRTEVNIADTNTTTLTPPAQQSQPSQTHGPEISSQDSQEVTADGPTEEATTDILYDQKNDEDLGKFNMTSISSLQISPDLMDQASFHSGYGIHDDKFDLSSSVFNNPSTFDFPTFPEPPPPAAGNPLFTEKETEFMSTFFDTVDQNTSFDHDFQDGLAQWTVPGLDLRKPPFDDGWTAQSNMQNGIANAHYSVAPPPTTVYGLPHYEPATSDGNYTVPAIPKPPQAQPLTQPARQPFNGQNFLSHLPNSSAHTSNDVARSIFNHRNPQHPSQCDPMYPNYPSLNIPVASPSGLTSSNNHTPSTTPKMPNYVYVKSELSGSESPPTSSTARMLPQVPRSSYATSSASSTSPQPPSSRPPRKKRRENLSEAQKRLNHITSEQRRRNLIQQGFNEIHKMVPLLRAQRERGDSKSVVLLKTVDYLLELKEGNERLRRMLKR